MYKVRPCQPLKMNSKPFTSGTLWVVFFANFQNYFELVIISHPNEAFHAESSSENSLKRTENDLSLVLPFNTVKFQTPFTDTRVSIMLIARLIACIHCAMLPAVREIIGGSNKIGRLNTAFSGFKVAISFSSSCCSKA